MKYIYRVLDYMAWFLLMEWLILVYIINRIIQGRLEIWNLSSRVHIRYLTRSLCSLVHSLFIQPVDAPLSLEESQDQ